MNRHCLIILSVALGISMGILANAERARAQGPAGAGASAATTQSSHAPHSLNPIKWVKKDSRTPTNSAQARSEQEKKLTAKLQAQGLLAANINATDACGPFKVLEDCVAALHASHNIGVDFNCLRADVTGVQTNVDLSGCKGPVGEKALSLNKAIHLLKPDRDAKAEAKNAEKQAKDDLKEVGA